MQVDCVTRFRVPGAEDGAKVWELIRQAGSLDLNSPYSYLMLCDYFRDTCVVAEDNFGIVGFLSAFRSQKREDTLFIWQVAVAGTHRKKGLAKSMIQTLLGRDICRNISYIEATISPSNTPSRQLFMSLAREHEVHCDMEPGYDSSLFPPVSMHEAENLFRIGPFSVHKS